MTAATPSADHRLTFLPDAKRLHRGLDAGLWRVAGAWRRRQSFVAAARLRADSILRAQSAHHEISDRMLTQAARELARVFRGGSVVAESEIDSGLALAAEAARRTLGLQPYVEQVMGALALEGLFMAEMATGEGKTLTIGLAAVLAAWRNRPVHVVTANDYLAERDAVALRPFYHVCGVTVGYIRGDAPPDVRRLHYGRAVVYGTSKEIVADFLRDRLVLGERQDGRRRALQRLQSQPGGGAAELVQRGLHTAIIDEADHVLIDEAVTPLLISQPRPNELLVSAVVAAGEEALAFAEGRDFTIERKYGELLLTEAGTARLAEIAPERCLLFRNGRWKEELVVQALRARELFQRGKHYIVASDRIIIVDETTGRPAAQRTWRQGLHQAIEAKEGLPLTPPNENMASLSFQRFFRLYTRLAGVTGTGVENADELWHIYHLPIVVLPTHRPCRRRFDRPVFTATAEEKWTAVVAEVARANAAGLPVLIGCGSVSASETLAARLTAAGFEFRLLTAAHLKNEADIVADAGKPGRITVATSLAGRGTDIRLGEGIVARGGLHVIATERAWTARVDRQLYGRCARQGDPGSVRQFASIDDELLVRFVPRMGRRGLVWLLRAWPTGGRWVGEGILRLGQGTARRIDFRRRLSVLRHDSWLAQNLPLWGLDQSLRER
jgi:preprotein translocase subunit SecA